MVRPIRNATLIAPASPGAVARSVYPLPGVDVQVAEAGHARRSCHGRRAGECCTRWVRAQRDGDRIRRVSYGVAELIEDYDLWARRDGYRPLCAERLHFEGELRRATLRRAEAVIVSRERRS